MHRGVPIVADSDRCWRVLETSHPPVYYVPRADVRRRAASRRRPLVLRVQGHARATGTWPSATRPVRARGLVLRAPQPGVRRCWPARSRSIPAGSTSARSDGERVRPRRATSTAAGSPTNHRAVQGRPGHRGLVTRSAPDYGAQAKRPRATGSPARRRCRSASAARRRRPPPRAAGPAGAAGRPGSRGTGSTGPASSSSTSASAAAGPDTSATATARFSATTGVGASAISWSYSDRIAGQSVAATLVAALCTALIEAWSWYGPGWLRRTSRATIRWPSVISARSHRARS